MRLDEDNRERINNPKHFTEYERINEVFQLFSTLEEQPLCEDLRAEEEDSQWALDEDSKDGAGKSDAGSLNAIMALAKGGAKRRSST